LTPRKKWEVSTLVYYCGVTFFLEGQHSDSVYVSLSVGVLVKVATISYSVNKWRKVRPDSVTA